MLDVTRLLIHLFAYDLGYMWWSGFRFWQLIGNDRPDTFHNLSILAAIESGSDALSFIFYLLSTLLPGNKSRIVPNLDVVELVEDFEIVI